MKVAIYGAGAIGALRGPKHGGANEVAFEVQSRYKDADDAETDIRERVGRILDPDKIDQAPQLVRELLADPAAFKATIKQIRGDYLYNLGHSVDVASAEIARLAAELAPNTTEKRNPPN